MFVLPKTTLDLRTGLSLSKVDVIVGGTQARSPEN